ncbi:MAG: imidazolonepropionase [Gammaproteobacteria bacterium]|nr:imidazolonepropionase [Gammaproteobacteria bacterium]
MHDLVVENARLYPMVDGIEPSAASSFAVDDGRISAIPAKAPGRVMLDARQKVVLPGFVDCHTHALYAGDRMDEHAQRLAGATYADIARSGGGIMSTVRAVRAATRAELVEQTLPRLDALAGEGVTTIEIKSGYGLSVEAELKMLAAIGDVGGETGQRVVPTFLGAHTVPAETGADDYVDLVCDEMLPEVASTRLSQMCDIYIESIAFDTRQARRILARACELGLAVRAHTDQLANIGGTRLAASFGALSCDHLEHTGIDDIDMMHNCGTVAVLLPTAFYFLRDTQKPPIEALRRAGVPMAIGSDLNPGSAPIASLLTALHMATTIFGLTAGEALLGVTRHAAQAAGFGGVLGSLAPGRLADFCVWDIPAPEFLVYQLGGLRPDDIFIEGIRQ